MTTREIFEKHVYLTSYCWEEHMRDVTKTVNMHNYRKANANSASGRLGVSLHKQSGKWRARLRVARQTQWIEPPHPKEMPCCVEGISGVEIRGATCSYKQSCSLNPVIPNLRTNHEY